MSNVSLIDDEADNLRLMAVGTCLMTVGGWLDFELSRLVVRFSVWLEETTRQVERDIEVVD